MFKNIKLLKFKNILSSRFFSTNNFRLELEKHNLPRKL